MGEDGKNEIADRMRVFRESKKLTQAQMAEALGASTPGYKNNEQGTTLPNSKLLSALYELGLSVNWLLSGDGPMLLSDVQAYRSDELVNGEKLGLALGAVEKIAAQRGLKLSADKRGKLAALVYQYFMLEKAEQEASTYISQLMELISNN